MTGLRGISDRDKPEPSSLGAVDHIGTQEIILHPFGEGDLTIDGEQFSLPATSGTAELVYSTVGPATANPPINGDMYQLEVGLTSAIRSESTAPSTVGWQWQGRNVGQSIWKDLHSADGTTTEGTAFIENTRSGRVKLDGALSHLPFEIQLIVNSDVAVDGVAKVKNSSYLKAITSGLYSREHD